MREMASMIKRFTFLTSFLHLCAFAYCSQFYKLYVTSFKRGRFFDIKLIKYTRYIKKWGNLYVTIRNWVKFALWALLIGGLVNAVASLIIRWDFYQPYLANGEISEFLAALVWNIVLGVTMSVMAQAGFFAYLTLHQVGVNIFRTLTLWNWIQILLIIIVLVDIIVFRFAPGANVAGDWIFYGFLLAVLVGVAIWTAIKKIKMTQKPHVLISTLFFMIVITSLEWIIALMGRQDNIDVYVALLLFPLVAVNAYQILMLPKYNAQSEEDRKRLEERRKARKETTKTVKA